MHEKPRQAGGGRAAAGRHTSRGDSANTSRLRGASTLRRVENWKRRADGGATASLRYYGRLRLMARQKRPQPARRISAYHDQDQSGSHPCCRLVRDAGWCLSSGYRPGGVLDNLQRDIRDVVLLNAVVGVAVARIAIVVVSAERERRITPRAHRRTRGDGGHDSDSFWSCGLCFAHEKMGWSIVVGGRGGYP